MSRMCLLIEVGFWLSSTRNSLPVAVVALDISAFLELCEVVQGSSPTANK